MLQYKNVWGGGNDPVPSIRNDFEYAKLSSGALAFALLTAATTQLPKWRYATSLKIHFDWSIALGSLIRKRGIA